MAPVVEESLKIDLSQNVMSFKYYTCIEFNDHMLINILEAIEKKSNCTAPRFTPFSYGS